MNQRFPLPGARREQQRPQTMQTPNSLGIGDGKAPGFFAVKKGGEELWMISSSLF